ncbi:MAG: ATP-dependent endonuclease [Chloroflexi bacterium]|nr:ATP-dependent endonuclease [Chloroflexota bacterium]
MVQIDQLTLKNYRSVKQETFQLNPLTILIGRNNAGKSNILRALKLLIEGSARDVSQNDFFDISAPVEIEATVSGIEQILPSLSLVNQTKLGERLTPDNKLNIRKVATLGAQGVQPGKIQVQQPNTGEYDTPTGIDAVLKAVLPEVIHIDVLDDPVEEAAGKTTKPMGKLIGLILDAVQQHAGEGLRQAYTQANRLLNVVTEEVEGVTREVDERIPELRSIESKLTEYTSEGFRDTRVRLKVDFPEAKELLATVSVLVREGGVETGLSFKGHGLQRVFYLSLLRALADQIRSSATATVRPFLLLFEEPELFLHPYAQQLMTAALKTIATQGQVVITTHSPLLVVPDSFSELCIISKETDGASGKTVTRCLSTGKRLPIAGERELLTLLNLQRSCTFLFSDRVLLVEGAGDQHLVTAMLVKLTGKHPSECGLGVVEVEGKDRLPTYKALLESIGLRVFGLVDLDFLWGGGGAGSVLKGSSDHSQFCEALQREAEPELEKITDEEAKRERRKEVFTRLATSKYAGQRDILCAQLKDRGYLVLREGEIEVYVGLGKNAKRLYLPAAREILGGTREVSFLDEIKQIIETVM